MKLSIIIPCYNEQNNIVLIFKQCIESIKKFNNVQCEIIFVNNGSTDKSSEIFKEELEKVTSKNFNFKLVEVPINKGYGYGIIAGINQSAGEIIAWTHADLQTDLSDVFVAFNLHQSENFKSNLIVKGKRKNRKLSELLFTFGMQIIASLFLKTWLDDINAQPKLFTRKFYENCIRESAPNDFSLDLFLLYWGGKKGEIKTIPVFFKPRLHGEAKGGGSFKTRIKLIKRTLQYILAFKRY